MYRIDKRLVVEQNFGKIWKWNIILRVQIASRSCTGRRSDEFSSEEDPDEFRYHDDDGIDASAPQILVLIHV